MATEVDTWSSAPQADGEYTNRAMFCFVGAKCHGAATGPDPLSLHGMGCSASHASPCALVTPETRTPCTAATITAHRRSFALKTQQLQTNPICPFSFSF